MPVVDAGQERGATSPRRPASARLLATIGVRTRADPERIGPLGAMHALEERGGRRPSPNLPHAMVGALEGRRRTDVVRADRLPPPLALDVRDEFEASLRDELVAGADDPEVTER